MEPRLALNTWWWWHRCQFDYYFCCARACKILLSSSWKAMETTVLFSARGVLAMHYKSSSMSAFLKGRQPALTYFFYPNYSETSFTYDHALDLHLPCSCSSLYWLSFQLALQSCFIDIPVLPSQPCFTDDPTIAFVFPLVSCGLLKAS